MTACLAAGVARAQDVAIDAFSPPPDQSGFTGFASTRPPGHLGLDVHLWLDYSLHTLEGRDLGASGMPLRHRVSAFVSAQLGLGSRAALALRVPVLLQQLGDAVEDGPLRAAGVGNPALDARVRLLGAGARPDGSVPDGAALAARGIVHLPVGTSRTYFADDRTRAELALIGDLTMFGIGGAVSFSYLHRFTEQTLSGVDLADWLRLALGLRLPLPMLARAYPGKVQESLLLEGEVRSAAGDFFDKRATPAEARLSYQLATGDFIVTAGAGMGLVPALGNPDFRALMGLGWAPRKHDQDADGIPDSEDACIHLAEDFDGFEDEDGCADDDNDGDLILDEDDRCPLEPAEIGRDDDEDGCTDPA